MIADLTAIFLPGRLRIAYLRLRGAKIGRDCRIGPSLINARTLVIGDNVYIGGFNLLHRLNRLEMQSGSRMNNFNWVTGAGTGDFIVERNSAITRLHFFEASGTIRVGANSIVAGRGSHFFTHGISSTNLDDVRPITIGPWCYVGSSSRFVPGASIARGTFVGMGAVVTKESTEEYILLGGSPARVVKTLSRADIYFDRAFLPHDHHPPTYRGGSDDEGA